MNQRDDNLPHAYERAVRQYGADAVHDAFAQGVPELHERGVPYLLLKARSRRLDQLRRDARREHLAPMEHPESSDELPSPQIIDPYELLVANERWGRVVDALAELPLPDALAVWWHFEGFSDDQILERFSQLRTSTPDDVLPTWLDDDDVLRQLASLDPTIKHDALRQRRTRALAALRRRLGSDE